MTDDVYRKMTFRAVRGLKRCGPFHYRAGDDPNELDCSLAGRVSHVFLVGITSARQLCRDAGEDPDYREEHPRVCRQCPNDAQCIDSDGETYCSACCDVCHGPDECKPLENSDD